MQRYTTVRPWSAMAAGVFFAAVTGYVLFEDVVRHAAPITIKHVMTLAVLVGTTYFGHRFWPQLKARHVASGLSCGLLFLGGTYMCVFMAAGRNAEVIQAKQAEARKHNSQRDSLHTEVESAKASRDRAATQYQDAIHDQGDADKAMRTACASVDQAGADKTMRTVCSSTDKGARTLCRSATEAARTATARSAAQCASATSASKAAAARVDKAGTAAERADGHYWDLVGKLSGEAPARVENGDIKAFAAVAAKLPWVSSSAEAIEATHVLLLPIGMALFAEIGLIVSLSIRERRLVPVKSTDELATQATVSRETVSQLPETQRKPLPKTGGGQPVSKRRAEQFLVTHLALHGSIESQDWLAVQLGVSKGTVSKWMRDWERRGLVSRSQAGRCKMIEATS